jgi:hypothetical protein
VVGRTLLRPSSLIGYNKKPKKLHKKRRLVEETVGKLTTQIRRSELNWLNKDPECAWVFERLAHVAASLNADYFGFDLTGFGEAYN